MQKRREHLLQTAQMNMSNRNPANIAPVEFASEIHVQNSLNIVSLSKNQVVKIHHHN